MLYVVYYSPSLINLCDNKNIQHSYYRFTTVEYLAQIYLSAKKDLSQHFTNNYVIYTVVLQFATMQSA